MGATVNRRTWLKLAVGGGTGLALGGVLDVTAVKAAARELKLANVSEFTTSCNFCSCGCGMVAAVRDGQLITLEGDFDHVVNRGSLCAKGMAMLPTHASPQRLQVPLAEPIHGRGVARASALDELTGRLDLVGGHSGRVRADLIATRPIRKFEWGRDELKKLKFIPTPCQDTIGHPTNLVAALDLPFVVLPSAVGGVGLWRRRPWGYVLAAVMLVKGAVYMLALSAAMLAGAAAGMAEDVSAIGLWGSIGVACLAGAVAMLRHCRR